MQPHRRFRRWRWRRWLDAPDARPGALLDANLWNAESIHRADSVLESAFGRDPGRWFDLDAWRGCRRRARCARRNLSTYRERRRSHNRDHAGRFEKIQDLA